MKSGQEKLFSALNSYFRSQKNHRFEDRRESLDKLRSWLGPKRNQRQSGYLNRKDLLSSYLEYYLPLHLPELYWILEHNPTVAEKAKNARSVFDLGCGPGTASLSFLLWLESQNPKGNDGLALSAFDQSRESLKWMKETVQDAFPKINLKTFNANLWDIKEAYAHQKVDLIISSHFLNECSSGPRVRDRKLQWIERLMTKHLNPGGLFIIIEPPLREPTLDLMWLRDELSDFVVAPCPRGVSQCPLLLKHFGWCYSQPPRKWAKDLGLAPFDKRLEYAAKIELTKLSFSYMVFSNHSEWAQDRPNHTVGLTDAQAPRPMRCTSRGLKIPSPKNKFRGDMILKEAVAEESKD